jgi:transposase
MSTLWPTVIGAGAALAGGFLAAWFQTSRADKCVDCRSYRSGSPALRERAMRMVAEVRPDYASEWAAIGAVAQKLGIGSWETLRKRIRQAEVDGGTRPGATSEESAEVRRLKWEEARG